MYSRRKCLELKLTNLNDCKEGTISMKSYFLLALYVFSFSSVLWAQPTALRKLDTKPGEHFDKFHSRLKIGYFGVFTSPTLYDMKRGDWDNAAISPEFGISQKGQKRNHDTWPTNLWHQISFNYNFGSRLNFVVNPRFMTPLSHASDMKAVEDRSLIQFQDFLVGFQGVVISSDNKKFNLWIRPGMRLPTSLASRNSNNGGFGRTTHELELAYNPTYDFNKTFQLGIFGQVRNWIFSDRYNSSRIRYYQAPYVAITLNDTTKLQAYYELMIENNKRWESINKKDPAHKDVWQNLMLGVAKDVTAKLNLFPYLGVFTNRPLDDKSFWLGAWVSYQIK